MKILIVDDHVLFREGLAGLIGGQPDINVIGQANSVKEAISLADEQAPDIILMDFSMPDGSGLDATRIILQRHPQIKVIFLTVHDDSTSLFEAIRAGARGYILKNVPVAQLLRLIRGVEKDEPALTPDMMNKILDEFVQLSQPSRLTLPAIQSLSPREYEVLELLRFGANNSDIAGKLFISENTVRNHIHNILSKLKLSSRAQVIRYLQKNDIQNYL